MTAAPDWLRKVGGDRRRIVELYLRRPYLSYSKIAAELGIASRNSVASTLRDYRREIEAVLGPRHDVPASARDPSGCRFIIDDDGDGVRAPRWRYCQAKPEPGLDYCAAHRAAMIDKKKTAEAVL